jgi:hypothetical protein
MRRVFRRKSCQPAAGPSEQILENPREKVTRTFLAQTKGN